MTGLPGSDNQISYEVRFIDLNAEPWRELPKDRLTRVMQDADGLAWVFALKDLDQLLKHIEKKDGSRILRAPKFTSFENAPATIFTSEQYCFAALRKTKSPHLLAALKASRSRFHATGDRD